MKLRELLSGLNVRASGDLDTEILGLAYDSREVSPGYLFFAIRGARANGKPLRASGCRKGSPPEWSLRSPTLKSLVDALIQVDDERA